MTYCSSVVGRSASDVLEFPHVDSSLLRHLHLAALLLRPVVEEAGEDDVVVHLDAGCRA